MRLPCSTSIVKNKICHFCLFYKYKTRILTVFLFDLKLLRRNNTMASTVQQYVASGEMWRFQYSFSLKNYPTELQSPVFANQQTEWRICVFVLKDEKFLAFLKLVSKNDVRINSTFSILNQNGDTRITNKFEGLVRPTCTIYNDYAKYISLSSLHSEADSYYFFTAVCEMNILKESPKHENPGSSLINHLSKLYETHKYSDVILNVKGTEFRVHKALLASRSDVFALMFDNEFKETQTNRVDINDMDEDVVQEMLKFIYTGQSPNLKKMALDLLQAGDKYALEDLKAMCASELSHKIELDTAIQTLILADRHHVDQLKIQSMDFIAVNAHSIRKTDCWTQLKNEYPLLYVEMLERKFFGGEH